MPNGHAQYLALAAAAGLLLAQFASPAWAAWSHPAVATHTSSSSASPPPVVTVGTPVVTTTTSTSGGVTTTTTTTKTPTTTVTTTYVTNANGSVATAVKTVTVTSATTSKTTSSNTPLTPTITTTKVPAGYTPPAGYPTVSTTPPVSTTTMSVSGGVTTTTTTTRSTKTTVSVVAANTAEIETCGCYYELKTVTDTTGAVKTSSSEATNLAPVTTSTTITSMGPIPEAPGPPADTKSPNLFSGSVDVESMVKETSDHAQGAIEGCQADTPPCIADALDAYAAALQKLAPYLPPRLRSLPTIVARAAKKVRAAKTTAEAVQAVKIAIAEVHKSITLLRADDLETRQVGTREGTLVVETLQVASDKLEKAVGL